MLSRTASRARCAKPRAARDGRQDRSLRGTLRSPPSTREGKRGAGQMTRSEGLRAQPGHITTFTQTEASETMNCRVM